MRRKHVNSECHKCKKVQKHGKLNTLQRPRQKQPARRANYIEDAEPKSDEQIPIKTDHDTLYNLFTVAGSGQSPIIMDVIQMELDTGASLSLITFRKAPFPYQHVIGMITHYYSN